MPKSAPKSRGQDKPGDTSLGELVHGWLRDAIRDGRYQPGKRIRETEVAVRLDVSRTPVREAFRRLQADGLLVLTPWRGAEVAQLDRGQVVELYAMRRVLEGTAAGLAAEHATDAEIDHLFDLLDQDKAARGDSTRRAEINREFHHVLYAAAHNHYLLKSLNALADSLALLKSTTYKVPGRADTALNEHVLIAKAIRNRDAEAAERTARQHIASAEQSRIELLFGDE